jgi:hypothetical protein
VNASVKRWARDQLLAELRELFRVGHACNVQTWARHGIKATNVPVCRARRAEARRLLRIAVAAVKRG